MLDIKPETNEIVVGREKDLYHSTLVANDFNWISGEAPKEPIKVDARTRYHKPPGEKAWCSHEVVLPGKSNLNLINTRSDHQLTEEQTTVELVCNTGGMDATSKALTAKQFEVNHQIFSTNCKEREEKEPYMLKRELKVTHLTVQNLLGS